MDMFKVLFLLAICPAVMSFAETKAEYMAKQGAKWDVRESKKAEKSSVRDRYKAQIKALRDAQKADLAKVK